MSENLLVKITAAARCSANYKFSRKGCLIVCLLECAASQWRVQRRKCGMKADKGLVVLMTTETAIKGFFFFHD